MPKPKKSKIPAPVIEVKPVTRAPSREEEKYTFNQYSKKVVKVKVVYEAESKITDLKKKKKR